MVSAADVCVRPRQDVDLPVLVVMLQRTHDVQGYPVRASAVRADWLAVPDELGAWVAEHDGHVVGHVALHPTATPGLDAGEDAASAKWQLAAGVAADRLAVVSRLITDGSVPGTGTELLEHAARVAADVGRVPVLLVDPAGSARGFYRRRGWREVGTAMQQRGEHRVDAVLMVSG